MSMAFKTVCVCGGVDSLVVQWLGLGAFPAGAHGQKSKQKKSVCVCVCVCVCE